MTPNEKYSYNLVTKLVNRIEYLLHTANLCANQVIDPNWDREEIQAQLDNATGNAYLLDELDEAKEYLADYWDDYVEEGGQA